MCHIVTMYYTSIFQTCTMRLTNNSNKENYMPTNEKKPDWKVMKRKIQNRFGKLSETDLEGLNGHMDRLPSKVQKAYNYDQKKATQECNAFNKTLDKAI